MILYPLGATEPRPKHVVPAWEAVERKQRQEAAEWLLVAQTDHAQLAADLAQVIDSPLLPRLDREVLRAIALHDAGWERFDRRGLTGSPVAASRHTSRGRPLSFLDMQVQQFLEAWLDSIAIVEEASALGGILVSEHFRRLAMVRLGHANDPPEERGRIEQFVSDETKRQQHLAQGVNRGERELAEMVDVLQFCDLLSLYLCCGAQEDVEFPQQFQGKRVILRRDGDSCRSEPALFGAGSSLAVSARRYPAAEIGATIAVLIT
jgi:hypothetical protein